MTEYMHTVQRVLVIILQDFTISIDYLKLITCEKKKRKDMYK